MGNKKENTMTSFESLLLRNQLINFNISRTNWANCNTIWHKAFLNKGYWFVQLISFAKAGLLRRNISQSYQLGPWTFCYMAEILPIRRQTLSNQSISIKQCVGPKLNQHYRMVTNTFNSLEKLKILTLLIA